MASVKKPNSAVAHWNPSFSYICTPKSGKAAMRQCQYHERRLIWQGQVPAGWMSTAYLRKYIERAHCLREHWQRTTGTRRPRHTMVSIRLDDQRPYHTPGLGVRIRQGGSLTRKVKIPVNASETLHDISTVSSMTLAEPGYVRSQRQKQGTPNQA